MPIQIHKGYYIVDVKMGKYYEIGPQAHLGYAIFSWLIMCLNQDQEVQLEGGKLYAIPIKFTGDVYCGMGLCLRQLSHSPSEVEHYRAKEKVISSRCDYILKSTPASDLLAFVAKGNRDWKSEWENVSKPLFELGSFTLHTDLEPVSPVALQLLESMIIVGSIIKINSSDFIIGKKTKILVKDYKRYYYNEDIWLYETVILKGKLYQEQGVETDYCFYPEIAT